MDFYKCKICSNFVEMIHSSGAKMVCCNEEMIKIIPNSTDGSIEKHVPVVKIIGSKVIVQVGSTLHPMVKEHYIDFVVIETKFGVQRKHLKIGDTPIIEFMLSKDDEFIKAYAYCNLHGLYISK